MATKPRRSITKLIAITLIIVVALGITLYLVSQQQDIRQRASDEFRDVGGNSSVTSLPENACDINGDSVVDLNDYGTLVECVQNDPVCTDVMKSNSDLNSDGNLNSLDLNLHHRTCQQ